ncbi:MAG: hypothetical protein JXM72_11325, partial [Deltaproteobacteria bacterium]|nr:hypothetical protein [Deltaproteobacteria bacterium]
TSMVPAYAAILPAACRHDAIIWTDSNTSTNATKPSEKRPLIIVTDETGRTYFIFQHQLAGMSWVASHHIP